jgi:hypothetical protein
MRFFDCDVETGGYGGWLGYLDGVCGRLLQRSVVGIVYGLV